MESKYPFKCVLKYIPSRFDNLKQWQVGNQRMVYDFKHGKISDEHRQRIVDTIRAIIGENPDEWVVTFIPAGTEQKTEERYAALASFLHESLPCPVYLHSIKNFEDYEPVHQKGVTGFKLHSFHRKHFTGKRVILIDDVITTGRTFRQMGDKLMYIGARSVYGVCFAMTIHPNLPIKKSKMKT